MSKLLAFLVFFAAGTFSLSAQERGSKNLVYVDKAGVLRYTANKKEASFFGVNYTVPFAYGYRSHTALGLDLEKAIDTDVYHFARLGLDAFRVHVWDTEITDSTGNLLENEHLRLFDYLVKKLEERNIKIFLTPLAFWGPGYPEPDIKTGSFSSKWNKSQVLVTEEAIKAQEAYLKQLLKHVNPYTGLTYGADPMIIALEINNEPHHSGPKAQAASYIDRMIKAVKSTGWNKPVFYNISESPNYAEPVANAAIDGVSFQWYPTGLVANRSLKGNYLPHVDRYHIPFDTIRAYKNKARMVYEFDAGDVFESYMYPAMARSFRTAGFQWATQFAYDPLATAYANTEYQTHYLNIAYTPSKAISLMIAGEVFRRVPRGKSYGQYPKDTTFDVFRVSYMNSLSEMNAADKFLYSNSTVTVPVNETKLKQIAGVGSSPVVQYNGTGAYFLDKIKDGIWRLEVMPDAYHVRDPFERASPRKEVTRIQYQTNGMRIRLKELGTDFHITQVSDDERFMVHPQGDSFDVYPGTYMVMAKGTPVHQYISGEQADFRAPLPVTNATVIAGHSPYREVSSGKSLPLHFTIPGLYGDYTASLEIRNTSNKWKTVPLQKRDSGRFQAEIPADMMTPGMISYRLITKKFGGFAVFPGGHTGDPYRWDNYTTETWDTYVAAPGAPLSLFHAGTDRNSTSLYNPDWRRNTIQYITTEQGASQLVMQVQMEQPGAGQVMAMQSFAGEKIASRTSELSLFDALVVRAGAQHKGDRIRVRLITNDAVAYAAEILPDTMLSDHIIPLNNLVPDSFLLLPRPYPGFQPMHFQASGYSPLRVENLDKIQVVFLPGPGREGKPFSATLQSIELRRRK
jgi:hypothetical protein